MFLVHRDSHAPTPSPGERSVRGFPQEQKKRRERKGRFSIKKTGTAAKTIVF